MLEKSCTKKNQLFLAPDSENILLSPMILPTEEIATKAKPKAIPRYAAIDGLRGLAVSLVLFHHLFLTYITRQTHTGEIGVDIFFVLSGFLITGILLNYKETK